jgi:uncharacterized protein (DUF433 family)
MKDLYENIWYCFVEQGMSPEEIAQQYQVPLSWVDGALELAEQDEYYDLHSKTLH